MMICRAGMVVALVVLTRSAALNAQETYLLRVKRAGQGATVQVDKHAHFQRSQQARDMAGKVLRSEEEQYTDTVVFRETIVAKPENAQRATHLLRQFDQAQRQLDNRVIPLPYQGQTYDIEKKGDRYHFQLASGKALPREAIAALDQEFNTGWQEELDWDRLVLPQQAVHVGDAWELDRQRLVTLFSKVAGMQIDASQSTARAKLTNVFQQENRVFAVVDVTIDLPTTAVGQGKNAHPFQPGSKISIQVQMTECIDGSMEFTKVQVTQNIDGSAVLNAPRTPPFVMTKSVVNTTTETRRELRP
jgi:hypothetical protein